MAVERTGAIYKSLFFDGEDSRDYGVYITGEAVFNAPEREVEMISIPGRNGQLALDKGRFENIEVTYPAGIYADTEADFAEAISNFRNLLCSRRGYVRLQDEYHPDEYRMAVYKNGLEVENALLKAGEFDIVFDCKPQRYLTSGEEPITMGDWKNVETVSGDIVQIDNSREVLNVKSLSVSLEPIQSGSGTPSPDNIRPISGRTECVTEVCGSNLFGGLPFAQKMGEVTYPNDYSLDTENKTFTFSHPIGSGGDYWQTLFSKFNSTQATAIITYSNTANNACLRFKYTDGTYSAISLANSSGAKTAIVVSSNASKNVAEIGLDYYSDGKTTVYYDESGVFEGVLTADQFEPYHGQTYTTTLGRTVYGGTIEQVSGQLTDEMGYIASYNGESIGEPWLSDRDEYVAGTTPSIGAEVVYTLATPQTYQLTPQEVELLVGDNNVWSEGEITLEYGELITGVDNPTLFDASPLLEITGFGDLEFNGHTITISGEYIGQVNTGKSIVVPNTYSDIDESISDNFQYANVGDEINIPFTTVWVLYGGTNTFTNINISSSGDFPNPLSQVGTTKVGLSIDYFPITFNYQTARTLTGSVQVTGNVGGTAFTVNTNITLAYDGANTISAQITHTISTSVIKVMSRLSAGAITYNSTQSTLGNPLYIDCDLGEAYKIEGGTLVSINNGVNLGSDLPTLAPGANTITFDNPITDLKVVPRWWKI